MQFVASSGLGSDPTCNRFVGIVSACRPAIAS